MSDRQKRTNALEFIASELAKRTTTKGRKLTPDQITDYIAKAGFFATIEAASEVLGSRVAPTPLYRIIADDRSLDFKLLEGKGPVPRIDAVDIEYLDLVYASLVCNRLALLSEGTTGTGKTYTVEQALSTIYAPENRRGLRLNSAMANVLQPYINGRIDNGVLVIKINRDAVRDVAALFIDEQNRGDTNAVIELLDGQVSLATGERADLGLLVPQIKIESGKIVITYDPDKLKPVVVHSAQNPPTAIYSGARGTDGAVGNRQVTVDFPNMALETGSATMNMDGHYNGQHGDFVQKFALKLAIYTGIDYQTLRGIITPNPKLTTSGEQTEEEFDRANDEYLNLHALICDPRHSINRYLRSALEGADQIIMLAAGKSLKDNFDDEVGIAADWTASLSGEFSSADFRYSSTIDTTTSEMTRIENVRKDFSEPFIERDKRQAGKVADALALITRYKFAYKEASRTGKDPFNVFYGSRRDMTLADVAASYAVVLSDKCTGKTGAVSPVNVINQVFGDYTSLYTDFANEVSSGTAFNLENPNQGLRYLAVLTAIGNVSRYRGHSAYQYAEGMINALSDASQKLRRLGGGSDTKRLLIARVNADLASLAGFVSEYRSEISEAFEKIGLDSDMTVKYKALEKIVHAARGKPRTNYTLSRVERVFGI